MAAVEKPTPATKESDKKPQNSAKKLTLVKKDANAQQQQSNAAAPAPSKTLSPAAVERSTELSPVIASHLPVKSPKPAAAAQETLTSVSVPASQPVVQESTLQPSLPPGLGAVNAGARQQKQQQQVRNTKQTSPVVMPIQPNSVSSVPAASVQFGSFGMSAKASATSTGTDPIKRYIIFIQLWLVLIFLFLSLFTSPDRAEEPASSSFQFNPPHSTSTATQSSRPASASATTNDSAATTAAAAAQMGGAPGLPGGHYQQQQQFGLGGSINYSMYESEQQRVMVCFLYYLYCAPLLSVSVLY